MTCATCRYLLSFNHPALVNTQVHECHRNPPLAQMVQTQNGPGFISAWPPIGDPNAGNATCGEYDERPPAIAQ